MNKLLFKIAFFLIKLGVDKAIWKSVEDVVIGIVKEIPNLTDREKREKAIEGIKEVLKQEGKEIKDSVLNLLIEIMVQKIKKNI